MQCVLIIHAWSSRLPIRVFRSERYSNMTFKTCLIYLIHEQPLSCVYCVYLCTAILILSS